MRPRPDFTVCRGQQGVHHAVLLLVAAFADRRRRRLENYVETLEELGVELRPLVACCLWFGVPRFTCAYSIVGLLAALLPRERLSLNKRRVGAAGGEGASPGPRLVSCRGDGRLDGRRRHR